MTQFNILDAGGPHRFKVSTEGAGAGGGWALGLELKFLEHMRDTLMPDACMFLILSTAYHCRPHPLLVSCEPIISALRAYKPKQHTYGTRVPWVRPFIVCCTTHMCICIRFRARGRAVITTRPHSSLNLPRYALKPSSLNLNLIPSSGLSLEQAEHQPP